MENLVLHACCAPCLVAPYYALKERFNVTVHWYNINIHPYEEYDKRLSTLLLFGQKENFRLITDDAYDLPLFLSKRDCAWCYEVRLRQTALLAKKIGADFFSSTLLYSKYQKHELIISVARKIEKETGARFYYEDFRPLWQTGIKLSKEKDMYRQQYCGCIFSEQERYEKQLSARRSERFHTADI